MCKRISEMLAWSLAMSKTRNLTVRREKELIDMIEEEAEHEKTDKSTVARKLIAAGIQEIRKIRALEDYRKGKCTIWKASDKAGISLTEMMELARQEKVPLHLSAKDVDQARREAVGEQ